jgi:hypothetical protein
LLAPLFALATTQRSGDQSDRAPEVVAVGSTPGVEQQSRDGQESLGPGRLELTPAGRTREMKRRPRPARVAAGRKARIAPQRFADAGGVPEYGRSREAVLGELRSGFEHPGGETQSAVDARLTERDRLLGELERPRFDLGPQFGPTREPVAAGDRELCRRERDPVGHEADLVERFVVAGVGRA